MPAPSVATPAPSVALSVDDDTEQGVINLWLASPALVAVSASGPRSGRLHSPKTVPLVLPSVQINSVFAREDAGTGYRLDRRTVTLTVRGVHDTIVPALTAVLAVYNRNMSALFGTPGMAVRAIQPLVYPSGARFVKWWPKNSGEIKQEETTAQGLEIWAATVIAEVTSVRLP